MCLHIMLVGGRAEGGVNTEANKFIRLSIQPKIFGHSCAKLTSHSGFILAACGVSFFTNF